MTIEIPVSAGELIDKITILRIKSRRIRDDAKRGNVRRELKQLTQRRSAIPALGRAAVRALEQRLHQVNRKLWVIEDALRVFESRKDFGAKFVRAARNVYLMNDKRAALKKHIDRITGSPVSEEKWFSVAP